MAAREKMERRTWIAKKDKNRVRVEETHLWYGRQAHIHAQMCSEK